MRKDYDIVGSYNNQRVTNIDSERTINMFEYIDMQGKKPKTLLSTAGLTNSNVTFSGSTGGFRAQFIFGNNIFCVIGNKVYIVNSGLISSLLGTLTTSSGYVGIDANTFQVIFVDGQKGYIFDSIALTFVQITDINFPAKPIDVCALDGFFVVANGDTNTFQLSGLNQGLIWGFTKLDFTYSTVSGDSKLVLSSTLNFSSTIPVTLTKTGGGASLPSPLLENTIYYTIVTDPTKLRLASTPSDARNGIFIPLTTSSSPTVSISNNGQFQQGSITSHPGTIVACNTLHRRLFLFSQNFTEVWENAGIGTNLPFRRINSALMEYGTPSVGSISVGFDKMFFLSQDKDGLGSIMEVIGLESIPVSNRALDFQLAQYASTPNIGVSDARGVLIKENGLIFYRLNFTNANHTYVYNVSMSDSQNPRWHEEEVLNGDRHPAQTHAYFNGVNYYGDYKNQIMYIVDSSVSTNNGEAIRRARIGRPIVPAKYNRTRIDRFQLDLLQGTIAQIQYIHTSFIIQTENLFNILTESGLNLLAEQDNLVETDIYPYCFLSISRDGGQSYGTQITSPMGKIGERSFRTVWRKLGTIPRGQAFVPQIQFWHPIPFIILGASWDFEIMPE